MLTQAEAARREGDHNKQSWNATNEDKSFTSASSGGEGQGEGQPGSTPHTSVLASDCQGAPDSDDTENDRHHNEFRVFRLLAQLPVEPPNQPTMNIQRPKRADNSEDSENWRPRNHFRVFRFPAWLAEEPENKQS